MSFAAIKGGAARLFNAVANKAVANAPTIFVGAGIVGIGAACVMACVATRKLDKVAEESKMDLDRCREIREGVKHAEEHPDDPDILTHKDGTPYTKSDVRKNTFAAYIRMIGRYMKLYGPAALMFIAGTIAVFHGHKILCRRYASAAAVAAGLTETLKEYRKRVRDQLGADEEDVLFRGGELRPVIVDEVVDPETGEVTELSTDKVVVTKNGPIMSDPYTYIFDEVTTAHSRNYSSINGVNLKMLRTAEDTANRLLHSRPNGFVELNEILPSIGLERDENAIGIGWVNMPGCEGVISFGIQEYVKEIGQDLTPASVHDFVLRFNCDGPIIEIIKRAKRAMKQGKIEYFNA